MTVLITGGAGYIGGHAVLALLDLGYKPVILDDLSTGLSSLVPAGVPLVVGDIGDRELVADIIRTNNVETIFHFAGKVIVSESFSDPLSYYLHNTIKAQSLIQTAVQGGIRNFVFSSTAAVYARSDAPQVSEDSTLRPISPYGRSKLMTEEILRDACLAHGMKFAILRYFNVAGADPQMRFGQSTRNATHLIKQGLSAALGEKDHIDIYGDDYDTPDGTCIRDFIHVADLASAHVSALEHLRSGGGNVVLNCGYGKGYSVMEVLEAIEATIGRRLNKRVAARRIGDLVSVVSDNQRLLSIGWKPQHDRLSTIIDHAYRWEKLLNAK